MSLQKHVSAQLAGDDPRSTRLGAQRQPGDTLLPEYPWRDVQVQFVDQTLIERGTL